MARKSGEARSKKKREPSAPRPSDGFDKTALTSEERQVLHFKHVKEYEGALGTKKKADADLKNVGKRIKAEGGSVALCKLTVALRTEEGETAFRTRIAAETEVAEWNGVGVQINMFDEDRTPAVDRARADGKRDGLAGNPCKPNYAPSTPQYTAYMDGFNDGQAVKAQGFKATSGMPHDEWKKDLQEQETVANEIIKGKPTIGSAPTTHRLS